VNAPGPTLVVSNPPHGLVDAKRAAPHLHLLPVELVLKVHYPIPEIWLAKDDPAAAGQAATALRDAGLAVTVTPGAALGGLPPQAHVETFSFGADGMTLGLDEQDVVLPYDLPVVVVGCSPRDAPPEAEGTGAWGVFADVYADAAGGVVRCGVSATTTDFAALHGTNLAGPAGRLSRFLQECEARFTRVVVDRRLLHLQLRRKQLPPPPGVPQRKGFAFGTAALSSLLQQIAPEQSGMNQCELGSRLVYLTRR
jgi:hypothetical protein